MIGGSGAPVLARLGFLPRGLLFYVALLALSACLFLGGATRGGYLSDAMAQLICVAPLLFALARLLQGPPSRAVWGAFAFCAAILALPLLQLIPLPSSLWAQFPGRDRFVEAFQILARPAPWMPISMQSESTWLAALALIPPFAVFFSTLALGWRERRLMSVVVIALAVLSAFLGLAQLVQGEESALRFFGPDAGPVGFFINPNHLAALLYSAAMFAAAWAISGFSKAHNSGEASGIAAYATNIPAIAATLALIVLFAVEASTKSRAGIALMALGCLGMLGMAALGPRRLQNWRAGLILLVSVGLALTVLGGSELLAFMHRFDHGVLADERPTFARVTLVAAFSLFPIGSGLGTFVPVYQLYERPDDLIPRIYANHAHNDLLELFLETGVVGPVLLGVFVYWLFKRTKRALVERDVGAEEIDGYLVRAAILTIFLLLCHSLVDYPLHTTGIMAVAAFSCALLFDPPESDEEAQAPGLDAAPRHLSVDYMPNMGASLATLDAASRKANVSR